MDELILSTEEHLLISSLAKKVGFWYFSTHFNGKA
jgi:hypothetical protein